MHFYALKINLFFKNFIKTLKNVEVFLIFSNYLQRIKTNFKALKIFAFFIVMIKRNNALLYDSQKTKNSLPPVNVRSKRFYL